MHPRVRESCRYNLARFLKLYMPNAFNLEWSADHLVVIKKIQRCILDGGQFAEAMPRGSGKTSIMGGAALWAALYAHRRYVIIIGAKAANASSIMDTIMLACWKNDRVHADFQEVTCSVRQINGQANRSGSQTYHGEKTHVKWNKKGLKFPEIEGSESSGCVIEADGLGAAIRGKNMKLSDGTILRPDLALLDDPQTEESARSVKQCDDLEGLIEKAVLGLSGPDKKIAALMACTIIEKADLSDRFLDQKRHPEWRGECFRMVNKWPDEQDGMWEEYAEFRRGEKEGEDREEWERLANEYYAENQEAMDAGSEVAWEERKFDDELSALQNAENLLIDRGKVAFFSEYQNDPQEAKPALYKITPEIVVSKVNNIDQMEIPKGCAFLTCMVDVNPAYGLNWAVAGFMGDMTGFIVDYGKHPEGESKQLIQAGETEPVAIFRGLKELTNILALKQYVYEGKRIPITLMLIDCGYQMTTVFRFVDWASVNSTGLAAGIKGMVCSRGRDAKKYRPTRAIGRPGNNLHLTEFDKKGRVIVHNGDYWKVHAQKAFLLPVGSKGSLSLYGSAPEIHKRMGIHMASEQLVEFLQGDVADSYNWHMQPGTKNDLLDAVIGCCVAASFAGATVDGEVVGQQVRKQPPRVKQHNV
jgi:hypothetical protein